MDKRELIEATKSTEIDSTSRFYVKEWVHAGRYLTPGDAQQEIETMFLGRFAPEDIEVVEIPGSKVPSYTVRTRRWNVVAEFKRMEYTQAYAEAYVDDFSITEGDWVVVVRNSRAEHLLTQYGKVKLRA